MGAATSQNLSKSVSDVSNSISNSTFADQSQINQDYNELTLDNCKIIADDDININLIKESVQKSKQITQAQSDTNLDNNIQQKMLQEAQSTVGSMGIGFASATNNASMFSNISNQVKTSVGATSEQWSKGDNDFYCKDSILKGRNISISLSGKSSAFNDQVVDSISNTEVVNTVSQSIDQKAKAKVEGLAAFFVALAILIGAIGYTFAKPLSTGPFKIVLVVILGLILFTIGVFMYIKKTPPFFNDDNDCSLNQPLIGGCEADCINYKTKTFTVKQPPLKYSMQLLGGSQGSGLITDTNLCQVVISARKASEFNGGYTIATMSALNSKSNQLWTQIRDAINITSMDPPPPLLINPHSDPENKAYQLPDTFRTDKIDATRDAGKCTPRIAVYNNDGDDGPCSTSKSKLTEVNFTNSSETLIANFNKSEWETYLRDLNESQVAIIRFFLWRLSGMEIDLSVYILDDEIVQYKNIKTNLTEMKKASDVKDEGYIFKFETTSGYDMKNGLVSGGKLTGKLGTCNDNTYKFHKFMRNIGSWLILLLIIAVFVFILKPRKTKTSKKPVKE
jgi:hypothetical protein